VKEWHGRVGSAGVVRIIGLLARYQKGRVLYR
jgi:hypothetical protein